MAGGTVIYGKAKGNNLDLSNKHYEMDADFSGLTYCSGAAFGATYSNGYCFCQAPFETPYHKYCKYERGIERDVGCYMDNRGNPDFEEKLSDKVGSVAECIQMVFNKSYLYAGLQAGGQCWGSNKKIGKSIT